MGSTQQPDGQQAQPGLPGQHSQPVTEPAVFASEADTVTEELSSLSAGAAEVEEFFKEVEPVVAGIGTMVSVWAVY